MRSVMHAACSGLISRLINVREEPYVAHLLFAAQHGVPRSEQGTRICQMVLLEAAIQSPLPFSTHMPWQVISAEWSSYQSCRCHDCSDGTVWSATL